MWKVYFVVLSTCRRCVFDELSNLFRRILYMGLSLNKGQVRTIGANCGWWKLSGHGTFSTRGRRVSTGTKALFLNYPFVCVCLLFVLVLLCFENKICRTLEFMTHINPTCLCASGILAPLVLLAVESFSWENLVSPP